MYKIILINLIFLLFFSSCSQKNTISNQKNIKTEAEILIENSNIKSYYLHLNKIYLVDKLVPKDNQELIRIRDRYISYEIIEPEIIKFINNNFTEEELIKINKFFNSDLGNKISQNKLKIIEQVEIAAKEFLKENNDVLKESFRKREKKIIENGLEVINILNSNKNRKFKINRKTGINKSVNNLELENLFNDKIYEELYYKSIENIMEEEINKQSYLNNYKDIIEDYISIYISYEKIKSIFDEVINSYFTEYEIKAIIDFENLEFVRKYIIINYTLHDKIKELHNKALRRYIEDFIRISQRLDNK